MRIAVLFYGRVINSKTCSDSIQKSLDYTNNTIDYFLSSDNANIDDLNQFIKIYNPVLYNNDKIEHNYNLSKYKTHTSVNINNMICHFINKDRVFNLLEKYIIKNNIVYDIVISLRTDLLINEKIPFNIPDDNTLYIPKGCDYLEGINDQIAYGNIISMKKYMNIILNTIKLLENSVILHPESLNKANIYLHNLKIVRLNLSYSINKQYISNKCSRLTCNYIKHRIINNNGGTHCCKACKINGTHGIMCRKLLFNPE